MKRQAKVESKMHTEWSLSQDVLTIAELWVVEEKLKTSGRFFKVPMGS